MTRGTVALGFMLGVAVGAGAIYSGISKPAMAQATQAGVFQIYSNQNSAGADAWRLNTVTGELVHCWTGGGG